MGMKPRCFKPNTVYEQTQRTVDRQFLFKPCPAVRNVIGASAARAQQTNPVKIYWLEFNINHEQIGIEAISDSAEHVNNLVRFKQTFHRILAQEINILHDRDGSVFSTPARTTECLDEMSIEDRFYYSLLNPVKDGLVDRVAHWEGFSSYNQLANGADETFVHFDRTAWNRQKHRRNAKSIQAFATPIRLEYTKLPSMAHLTDAQYQSQIRKQVRIREQVFRDQRKQEGRTVIGKAKLSKVNPRSKPANPKKNTPKPWCHSSCRILAAQFKEKMMAFYNAYTEASAAYRKGAYDTVFPYGSIRPPLLGISL